MKGTYRTSRTYPGVPTQSAIEPAILEHVADGRRYGFGEIYAAMVVHFDLTPEQEKVAFDYAGGVNHNAPSGANVFYKYCNNACRSLVRKEWLVGEGEYSEHAEYYEDKDYRITGQGLGQVTSEGD